MDSLPTSKPYAISVVMALYNDEPKHIKESIGSMVLQDCHDWNLIVVDDSTHIETRQTVESFRNVLGGRLLYIHNPIRLGFVNSLNAAISEARGEFIARMDGDDIAAPSRLRKQLSFLRQRPEISIVGGHIQIISWTGEPLSVRHYLTSPSQIRTSSFLRNPLAHPAVMFRRAMIEQLGGYDPSFRRAEDYELWLRALSNGYNLANIDEIVLNYRMQTNYAQKRDRLNWQFASRAKLMHFSWKSPLTGLLGISASVIMSIMPPAVINTLYHIDFRRSLGKVPN